MIDAVLSWTKRTLKTFVHEFLNGQNNYAYFKLLMYLKEPHLEHLIYGLVFLILEQKVLLSIWVMEYKSTGFVKVLIIIYQVRQNSLKIMQNSMALQEFYFSTISCRFAIPQWIALIWNLIVPLKCCTISLWENKCFICKNIFPFCHMKRQEKF